MLYRGIVCERGPAYIDVADPLIFGCDDDEGEATLIHGTVTIQHDAADANHNPSLEHARFFLGNPGVEEEGAPWPYLETDAFPPEAACLGGVSECKAAAEEATGVLCQYAYQSYQITIQYDPAAREKVDGRYEDLEFSVFATDGELERRFVVFEGDRAPVHRRRPVACLDDADCADHAGARWEGLRCREEWMNPKTMRVETRQVTEKVDVLEGTVDWKVPEELRSRSQLVRFFFTVLDRRGGFDWTTRALCLN
jgi:hypothetical protein